MDNNLKCCHKLIGNDNNKINNTASLNELSLETETRSMTNSIMAN